MFNRKNTTLVVQGNITPETKAFAEHHKLYFDNIIISTWVDQVFEVDGVKVIKSEYPPFQAGGNMNYQLVSSLAGCKTAETDFVVKVRSDIKILEPDKWLQFFAEQWSTNKLFVLGLSKMYPFSGRDQLFAGRKDDMVSMFNIPLVNAPWHQPSIGNELYPELYMTLYYYSQFSEKVRIFLNNPQVYLYAGAPLKHEVMEEWNKIGTKYMWPVPRALKYHWPKHFQDKDYNYDETTKTYGEFWHDDLV